MTYQIKANSVLVSDFPVFGSAVYPTPVSSSYTIPSGTNFLDISVQGGGGANGGTGGNGGNGGSGIVIFTPY